MTIPPYHVYMLPLLESVADGATHRLSDLTDVIARRFNFSEEELKQRVNGMPVLFYRINWARTYLKKAGLVDIPIRGNIAITPRGRELLATKPEKLTVASLMQFSEFKEFVRPDRSVQAGDDSIGTTSSGTSISPDLTPEEQLDNAHAQLRGALAQDILAKVLEQSPAFFERLVVDLIVKMGYGGSVDDAGKAIGQTGDEGIDGVIKEDKLGLDIIYLQAKRWKPGNTVGRPEIQKFVGALAGQGAKKGIFITTSEFTKDAKAYRAMNDTKVVLIDGRQLAELMIDHDVGVTVVRRVEVKRVDEDWFGE